MNPMDVMYSCREMVDLVAKEIEAPLPLTVRIRMAAHLAMCVDCRIAKQQLLEVERLVSEYFRKENSDTARVLSKEARSRIEEKIAQGL